MLKEWQIAEEPYGNRSRKLSREDSCRLAKIDPNAEGRVMEYIVLLISHFRNSNSRSMLATKKLNSINSVNPL